MRRVALKMGDEVFPGLAPEPGDLLYEVAAGDL
jgi:hypothetical protein